MFAESTRKTYSSQLRLYLQFCNAIGILPVPISPLNLARYIAFMARRLTFSSTRQYLNAVRLLHLEMGQSCPPFNLWYISSLLKGVRRVLGDATSPKLPITLTLLQGIFSTVDLTAPFDVVFWAACLVAFFSFFRKSNLLVQSAADFNPETNLCRGDVSFTPQGCILRVRWSKTIQYKERVLLVPLPRIAGSVLCPSQALLLAIKMAPAPIQSPVFQVQSIAGCSFLTHSQFIRRLRESLRMLNIDAHQYSSHSFRRGGASLSLEAGLPADLIQQQGDWRSMAYKRYLDVSLQARVSVAQSMGTFVARSESAV